MPDRSLYKVGVVLSLSDCPSKGKGGNALRACQVDVGDADGRPLTVVTAAANVRADSRIVVAPVGSTIVGDDGEEMDVKKTAVGGVTSEGVLCDSAMLGWKGGAVGVAATVPADYAVGSPPPASKPRPKEAGGGDDAAAAELPGLFEKKVKLTKEEKKKQAEERKARLRAKKAAKEAAASEETPNEER